LHIERREHGRRNFPENRRYRRRIGFDGHKGEIDVLSWSWGLSQGATTHVGGGGGSGKANVQDLTFVHSIDLSSANLLKNCFTGKHIANALLTQRKAGGDKSLPF